MFIRSEAQIVFFLMKLYVWLNVKQWQLNGYSP